MPRICDYIILQSPNRDKLSEDVEQHLKWEWELYGYMTPIVVEDTIYYIQTLISRESESNESHS